MPVETPEELEAFFSPEEHGVLGTFTLPSDPTQDLPDPIAGIMTTPWASLEGGGMVPVNGEQRVFRCAEHQVPGVKRGWWITIGGGNPSQVVDRRPSGDGVVDLYLGDA